MSSTCLPSPGAASGRLADQEAPSDSPPVSAAAASPSSPPDRLAAYRRQEQDARGARDGRDSRDTPEWPPVAASPATLAASLPASAAFPLAPGYAPQAECGECQWGDVDLSGYAPLCSPTPLPGGATYTILTSLPVPPMLPMAPAAPADTVAYEDEPRTLHELQSAVAVPMRPHPSIECFKSPTSAAHAPLHAARVLVPQAQLAVEVDSTTRALERGHEAQIRQQHNSRHYRSQEEIERAYRKNACDRERCRMADMNRAYDLLRMRVPTARKPPKKLSKIECLRLAIKYIRDLREELRHGQQGQAQAGPSWPPAPWGVPVILEGAAGADLDHPADTSAACYGVEQPSLYMAAAGHYPAQGLLLCAPGTPGGAAPAGAGGPSPARWS